MATKSQAMFFLNTVIRPALQKIELWSQGAEELMLGTALVESDLLHRKQIGGGPARGLFQMEIATHDDIWNNFLKYRSQLANAIASLQSSSNANKHVEIENNDQYACAMARASYLRAPAPLPQAGDILGMASYWKQYYNTVVGAGTVSKYVQKWHHKSWGTNESTIGFAIAVLVEYVRLWERPNFLCRRGVISNWARHCQYKAKQRHNTQVVRRGLGPVRNFDSKESFSHSRAQLSKEHYPADAGCGS